MCLYPKMINNPKYKQNKKNGGNIPPLNDIRVMQVPIGCGECMECMKQKGLQWKVRLSEELRCPSEKTFITLTYSNIEYEKLYNEVYDDEIRAYEIDNKIATISVKRFLERWRKKYKKSIKHWLVTELGHEGTENIHLHGIIWSNNIKEIENIWKYGYIWGGEYVNEETVGYIIKYVMKTDEQHKEYKPKILTSPGIGSGYTKREDSKKNRYRKGETKEEYRTRCGRKMNMPIYYRNKIYTDEEREKLWIEKLNKMERYVDGQKVSIANGIEQYQEMLKTAQTKNTRLGYGGKKREWEQIEYEEKLREINQKKRLS
jgi:hypothetical protein